MCSASARRSISSSGRTQCAASASSTDHRDPNTTTASYSVGSGNAVRPVGDPGVVHTWCDIDLERRARRTTSPTRPGRELASWWTNSTRTVTAAPRASVRCSGAAAATAPSARASSRARRQLRTQRRRASARPPSRTLAVRPPTSGSARRAASAPVATAARSPSRRPRRDTTAPSSAGGHQTRTTARASCSPAPRWPASASRATSPAARSERRRRSRAVVATASATPRAGMAERDERPHRGAPRRHHHRRDRVAVATRERRGRGPVGDALVDPGVPCRPGPVLDGRRGFVAGSVPRRDEAPDEVDVLADAQHGVEPVELGEHRTVAPRCAALGT